MQVTLAPMEGVVDHLMRDMLTRVGGFDLCVTEFVRVVEQLLPKKVFYKYCPELYENGYTPAGVPVKVQLLGNHPEYLAENAERAIELGSHGVDLNFGCPAKTVNKSKGGAVLLQEPETLYKVVKAVREAVPREHSVSAKIRLGYNDKSLAFENAQAIESAGADLLTIHARTRDEAYDPPAHWHWIAKIKYRVDIPIVANGEIWGRESALACQAESECEDIMIGRGALSMPNLAHVVKGHQEPMLWCDVLDLLLSYSEYEIKGDKGCYFPNRIKQWLRYITRQYEEAQSLYLRLRVLKSTPEIIDLLNKERQCSLHI
ncbi:tRNA dihydrouridine(16) synthase DusC [Alteromonadaceae bacterium M269]|nr:tRNA dihydrouridine(16) synthase DusC [Alteromonadaceae bacterium M269]